MNRHQNDLKLLLTDAKTGDVQTMYEEQNKYYVEINDNWWFLKDGKNFIFTSEMNGYTQLYNYSIDGKKKKQIFKMNYDIASVDAVDEARKLVYYTVAYPTPWIAILFVSDFDGKKTYMLTSSSGWHRVELNDDFTEFYDYHSTLTSPQVVTHYKISHSSKAIKAEKIKVVNESQKLKNVLDQYAMGTAEFIRVPNSKGDTLNGWMLKPADFDPSKKYPVLFCNYGGPGSQQVANRFGAVSMWHQMLAQNGFIVVSVDNTGTGYRGEEFKKKLICNSVNLKLRTRLTQPNIWAHFPTSTKTALVTGDGATVVS